MCSPNTIQTLNVRVPLGTTESLGPATRLQWLGESRMQSAPTELTFV